MPEDLPWPVPTHWDFFGPNLPKGLKGTLDRLGLETIDLYQVTCLSYGCGASS